MLDAFRIRSAGISHGDSRAFNLLGMMPYIA